MICSNQINDIVSLKPQKCAYFKVVLAKGLIIDKGKQEMHKV